MQPYALLTFALCATVAAQEPLEVFEAPVGANGFGFRVAALGDIDQDGLGDVAVGDRSGRVWILTGRPFTVASVISVGPFLAGLGALDTDGDGVREVAIAHQSATASAGINVDTFDARTGALRASFYDFEFGHEPEVRLTTLRDRTGDGIEDLLVGMPSQDFWHPAYWLSSVKVLAGGVNGSVTEEFVDDARGLGEGGTAMGDVDQDGYEDYAVGSRVRYSGLGGSSSSAGTVFLVGARTGPLAQRMRWRVDGPTSTSELGEDVVSIGDRNGDGIEDLVATESIMSMSSTLRLRVMSGADGATLGTRDFPGEAFLGPVNEPELEPCGDLDGDGVREFVMIVRVSGVHGGPEVRVLSGATLRPLHVWSDALQALPGELGLTEAALVEDLDHDGSPELLVGRPDGPNGGRVLVFPTRATVGDATCAAAVANSTGGIATLRLAGHLSVTADELQLIGQSIPASTWVLPVAGTVGVSVPMAGGSTGTLCVGGVVRRLGDIVARADAGGAFYTRVALATWHPGVAGGAPTAATAGETWHFQLWFRDSSLSGATSNFSTAVEATFQ
ncbi:MAG: integrin alpha [Planctomycetota bacterium]